MNCNLQLTIIASLLLASLFSPLNAQQANSLNAAGFIKLDLESSNFYQVTVPLLPLGNPLLPGDAFDDLPNGSTIIFWDQDTQKYNTDAANETKLLGNWTPNTNDLYQRSFWLYVGETASPTSFTSFVYGRVPDSQTLPTQNVTLVTSGDTNVVNMVSYAFPVDIDWTNSTLAQTAADGSYLLMPDETEPGFVKITKNAGTWSSNTNITAGQAFWFHAAPGSTNNWQEVKPYDWP